MWSTTANRRILFVFVIGVFQCIITSSEEVFPLDKLPWKVSNNNGANTLPYDVVLPTGIYTLLNNCSDNDILFSDNDVKLRWAGKETWTWSLEFDSPDYFESVSYINLTFFGIDTVSTIALNNEILGKTDNMFVRYTYSIKHLLKKDSINRLQIVIKSPILAAAELASTHSWTPPECPPNRYNGECHMNFLRKMQASFAWDWGLAAPSMGIWKTILLEQYDAAIIRDVDVINTLSEDYWIMHVRVYLQTEKQEPFHGVLTMYGVDLLDEPVIVEYLNESVDYRNPVIVFEQKILEVNVKRWWPNGYGEQHLYYLHFVWSEQQDKSKADTKDWTTSGKYIRTGFRTLELIQKPLSDGDSFFFKVNGFEIFMKGSNWIPSHILPEHSNNLERIKHLLKAAKNANMNMLRVWGGGIYETDEFYEMADFYGILIWQDMMFACAMYPVHDDFLKSVETETIQNALRIAHHPSIALWATNNENEQALVGDWYKTKDNFSIFADNYRRLYVATVDHALKIISHPSRPDVQISSPSNGLKTREDNFLSNQPSDTRYGDIHYYNYGINAWNPVIYPKPRFASEYGFQSLPSLISWKQVQRKEENLKQLIEHRQHLPTGNTAIIDLIVQHFNLPSDTDPKYVEALIYLSQISQAMVTKTETEVYRSQRVQHYTMGALYWQLNDVWVAPSWSSIDFLGTFKILHYWAKEFLAPLTVIAHVDELMRVNVTVTRDTIDRENRKLSVIMKTMVWSQLLPKSSKIWNFTIKPNTVELVTSFHFNDLFSGPYNKRNCFFEFSLASENGDVLSTTYLFPEKLKNVVGLKDPNVKINKMTENVLLPIRTISLSVRVQYPGLFIFLELNRTDIRHHEFSKNGFIQTVPIQTVILEYCVSEDQKPVEISDINVLVANDYLPGPN